MTGRFDFKYPHYKIFRNFGQRRISSIKFEINLGLKFL